MKLLAFLCISLYFFIMGLPRPDLKLILWRWVLRISRQATNKGESDRRSKDPKSWLKKSYFKEVTGDELPDLDGLCLKRVV
ncbi:hypothetical protein BJV82DRAFT_636153 [Fennellomyces sp. T-0311]|nr:hypothetical protein BJV82DRAFT_636153 [Fennellomyces sp. T-0311]